MYIVLELDTTENNAYIHKNFFRSAYNKGFEMDSVATVTAKRD